MIIISCSVQKQFLFLPQIFPQIFFKNKIIIWKNDIDLGLFNKIKLKYVFQDQHLAAKLIKLEPK